MVSDRPILRLTLIRHAKSSWKFERLHDIDRPLNKRGRNDALMMARRLAERQFQPQHMFTSSALRALRTAEAVGEAIQLPPTYMTVDRALYHADAADLLKYIYRMSSPYQWVALVGHNPDMTILANRLGRQDIANIPTCGVVDLTFAASAWKDIAAVEPEQFTFDYPKNKH